MDTANAFLARVKTNERIELSKSEFCIGREEGCVDHLVTDNTAISRRHARFIRKDGGWFVEDLDSVNRTYLNGVALKAGKTFLLRDGDTVRLANEEFLFLSTLPAPRTDSPARSALYMSLLQGLRRGQRRIDCPAQPEQISAALHQILLDDPQLCHFEGDWRWDDGVVPVYTLNAIQRELLPMQVKNILRKLRLDPSAPNGEKARVIYNWLAENVRYDLTAPHSQSAYGALVERRAVCKGIAKAFQLLLRKVDVPCELVEGSLDGTTKHVWNRYQVDGIWYHSDVTMAYPQFRERVWMITDDFTAVSDRQIRCTHRIWADAPKKREAGFFQSLQNCRREPHSPLAQIPASLQKHLPGAPQFVAAGSVSDVYRFDSGGGSVALKRIFCGEEPGRLYYAMRESAMLQRLAGCDKVAQLHAWDTVREPDGFAVYLVLDYAMSLEEYCGGRQLPAREAMRIVHSVCDALQQCYDAGVAHLDVQPGNILVTREGNVKLTDFSSAISLEELPGLAELRGTPAYMAPEVYHRKAYSQAADVYSMGILLYCLLNGGQLPFGDAYPAHEAAQKRMEGMPVTLQLPVEAALRACVEKACSFDPADRYPDVRSFSAELSRLMYPAPKQPMPPLPNIRPVSGPVRPPQPGFAVPGTPKPYSTVPGMPGPIPPAPPSPPPSFSADNVGLTVMPSPRHQPSFAAPAPNLFQADTFGESTVLDTQPVQPVLPPVQIDKVQFSAVAPKQALKGECTLVQLYMYEQTFRCVVDEALQTADAPMQEKKTGFYQVREGTRVKVVLESRDVDIPEDAAEEVWTGGYLSFDFALEVPVDCPKHQALLKATVYFDGIPATRLLMTLRLQTTHEQRLEMLRSDVLTAFVSYASQDRSRVGALIQGMKKARPDMDIFFDVSSLRSGDDWEKVLRREIELRDLLFLCWSRNAKESQWVDMEWRYALENKGIEAIEPIPIDPPDVCPPPEELRSKHFNDSLLYIINRP